MVPQRLLTRPRCDFVMSETGGIDPKIGDIGVERPTVGKQGIEAGTGVLGLQEGTSSTPRGSLKENVLVRIQPCHNANFSKEDAIVFRKDGSPSC